MKRKVPYYVTSLGVMKLENLVTPREVGVAACPTGPGQLAQDDDALYWTCPGDDKVWRWMKTPL